MKYTMRSLLPGMGSVRGLWTRVYFTDFRGGGYHYCGLYDVPLTRACALEFIREHGYEELAKDSDTIIYGTPDGAFRNYARAHNVKVPDTIGMRTIYDKNEER